MASTLVPSMRTATQASPVERTGGCTIHTTSPSAARRLIDAKWPDGENDWSRTSTSVLSGIGNSVAMSSVSSQARSVALSLHTAPEGDPRRTWMMTTILAGQQRFRGFRRRSGNGLDRSSDRRFNPVSAITRIVFAGQKAFFVDGGGRSGGCRGRCGRGGG